MAHAKLLKIDRLETGLNDSCKALWYFNTDQKPGKGSECLERKDVIDLIRHGFSFSIVGNVLHKTRVSKTQLSQILHISTRQLNRYHDDDLLSAEQSGFLYEFSRIYVRGADIFGDQETFEKWLHRPQMALGMQVPVTLLDTPEGIRVVDDLLSQIEYGFYS